MENNELIKPSRIVLIRDWTLGRSRVILGGVLLITALFYFAYFAFQDSQMYYLTVNEVVTGDIVGNGQILRVNGKLLSESFVRESGSTEAAFTLVDLASDQRLDLVYDGVVPDLFFNEHSQIVAQGRYHSDGVFEAELIIVKCPSKYASESETT